jgi:hypothetical protein
METHIAQQLAQERALVITQKQVLMMIQQQAQLQQASFFCSPHPSSFLPHPAVQSPSASGILSTLLSSSLIPAFQPAFHPAFQSATLHRPQEISLNSKAEMRIPAMNKKKQREKNLPISAQDEEKRFCMINEICKAYNGGRGKTVSQIARDFK